MYLYFGLIAHAFLRSFERATARQTKEPRLAVLSLAPMTATFSGQRARLSLGRMGFKITSLMIEVPLCYESAIGGKVVARYAIRKNVIPQTILECVINRK